MRNKKVCILTSVHSAFDVRIFHKQAKTLAKAGYDVVLIAQHNKDEEVDGVKIIALPLPKNRLWRIAGLIRILRLAIAQSADVYHFHDPELLPLGMMLKLITRKIVVYDIHENVKVQILNKLWLPKPIRKPLSLLYQLVERICFNFMDKIIIAEDSYLNTYKNLQNLSIIHNYPLMSYSKSKINRDMSLKPTLAYIGGITKLRGAMEMIDVLSLLQPKYNNIKLNLVGPIYPKTLKTCIETCVKKYGLEKNINIFRTVSHEEVYDIISQSHIGLSLLHPDPNYTESLPTKLFEYMSVGFPVIASNFPLWKEIVEGNNCGVTVDPLTPKEIAEAIEYLLSNPELMKEMGENGRRAVLEKYNWEKESEKLLNLYKEVIG